MKGKPLLEKEGRKKESNPCSTHGERPLTSMRENMPVFREGEIAPSSVVFYNTNYLEKD